MNWRLILGAAALVLGLAACGDSGEGDGTPTCKGDEVLCGGACADTSTDPRNCGACGTICGDGEICADGACTLVCPVGQEACDGACYDLGTSRENCGACGNVCGEGEVCSGGACVTSCPAGQTACDGGCFDTGTAIDHCGACNVACGDGETCDAGTCVPACPAGQELCDGGCYDLQASRENCGACGTACGAGEVCAAGVCAPTCAAGQTECGGTCTNLETDAANCGACGTACATGEICVDGACRLFCAPGLEACGGSCVDTDNDRNHCGGCGVRCGDAEVCTEGECVTSCTGFADDLCDGACTNTDVDPRNCGACGNACAAGEVCSAGVCTGFCAPSLTECQDGACTSLQDDPANCGACGTTCDAAANGAAVCTAGNCDVVCLQGYGDCNRDLRTAGGDGCEVNFATDPANCGMCGNACNVANGAPACVGGECAIAACNTGFADCDQSAFNGCEVRLADDFFNCGACGVICGSDQYCSGGTCSDRTPADTCAAPAILHGGQQTIYWAAPGAEYLTEAPSCNSTRPAGPDLVFQYTANYTGQADITVNKPSGFWHLVATTGECGPITAENEVACFSSSSSGNVTFNLPVTAGTTYNLFLVGSSSGTLRDPLSIRIDEIDCATLQPVATELSPASGSVNPTLSGSFTATFSNVVRKDVGSFHVTAGTTTHDIPANDPRVQFAADGRSVTIEAGDLPPGAQVSISWTGLQDAVCGLPVPAKTWQVTMPAPPCAPGVDGVVGPTMTRIPFNYLGSSTFGEYYTAVDDDPNGWVYVGNSSNLFRMPKKGGRPESLYNTGGIGYKQVGLRMMIDGPNLYTLRSATSGTSERFWRLSNDKGATFEAVDAVVWPTDPGKVAGTSASSIGGIAARDGRVYFITEAAENKTEVWSADVTGELPATAAVEFTFANIATYQWCTDLALDDRYFYSTCRKGSSSSSPRRIVRIDRTTHAVTDLVTAWDTGTYNSPLFASDTNGDGIADVLYHRGDERYSTYVCQPASDHPYIDEHFNFAVNSGVTNGMGFDPVENALWVFDRSTNEFIKVK